ncbi:TPA: hypothetical protein ACWZ7C_004906 [Escherichia coli]
MLKFTPDKKHTETILLCKIWKNVRNVIEVVFYGGEKGKQSSFDGKKDVSCRVTIRDATQVPVQVLWI